MQNTNHTKPNHAFANILLIGLLTGTLDAIAACIWNYKVSPLVIFKFIASGVFGKAAFDGGAGMVAWGLLFHYFIAFSFSAVFYLLYPTVIRLIKDKYTAAIIFALITWLITNLLIVPLSQIGWKPMGIKGILIGFGILIFTIGLPISLIADRVYRKKAA